ncbi:CzcE family metal-binding protein [Aromatoleum evansii]|uniref:CzcE family metal-binding protein n=1 Tax=Aromatoleum evansii TaxID=59406 RepID=UPI00145CB787|nr:CzcE family metal-binding protein [Aromatoleum evansii]NMG29963.1 CzcE family metal-binding protein [Aromatoleum evansii]
MNVSFPRVIALTILVGAGTANALAHTDYSEAGASHWLEHAQAASGQPTKRQLAPYGYLSSAPAERTAIIDRNTRSLNVVQMETVAIRIGDKTINWTFDAYPRPFPLTEIIPEAKGVTVYVEENPMYRGGR